MPKVNCPNCGEPNNDINFYCLKCKRVLIETPKYETSQNEIPIFIKISLFKVCILSFISLGIYDFFWFYRQWTSIRRKSGFNFLSLLFSIFRQFSVFGLAGRIEKNAKNKFDSDLLSAAAIGYFICGTSIIVNRIFKLNQQYELFVIISIYFVVRTISTIAITYFQYLINNNLDDKNIICEYSPIFVSKRIMMIDIAALALAALYWNFHVNYIKNADIVFYDSNIAQVSNYSKWITQTFRGGLTLQLPFELQKDIQNENKENTNAQIDESFSKNIKSLSIYVSYLQYSIGTQLSVDWNQYASMIIESNNSDNLRTYNLKSEAKIYGNYLGKLYRYKANNTEVRLLKIVDNNKQYIIVISNIDIEVYNKVSEKILESIVFSTESVKR
ncbi:MAG: hypothetical protein LBO62_06895 [Endomicrobium sp.]|nr:hypothetical protein [Endomicrobium sp.]